MNKYQNNFFKFFLIAIFSVSINAEYKLGTDYRIVAVSYTHLTLPTKFVV